ncbi:hypothetical protein GCM10023187_07230 [Nibrella viscosa]|uniref:Phosphatidic acid phosphatase type 2/haloperoxidase domain-containing protein n=1 Tax=Nibrella viscosa TaxID=1084524 RepID=A0ABP8JYA4_9BACT
MQQTTTPRFIVSLVFTLWALTGWSQSPYRLAWKKEAILLGASAVTIGTSYGLGLSLLPLQEDEIINLNRLNIKPFDRSATYNWSPSAKLASDLTLLGSLGSVGLVWLPTIKRDDWTVVPLMFIETLALNNGIQRSIKNGVRRNRPFLYNPDVPLAEKEIKDARRSFFSGHTANAFASAVFASEVFRHYFPDSRLKPVVWTGTLTLATATAYLRYAAGRHYPTDLLAGAAFGSLIGWGIPKLHQVKNRSEVFRRLTVEPWTNGTASGLYVSINLNSVNFTGRQPIRLPEPGYQKTIAIPNQK